MKSSLQPGLLALIFSLFISLPSLQAQKDVKAEAILKKVRAKYELYKTMKVEFTQVIVNSETKINQTNKGLLYMKEDMFRLEMVDQVMISDDTRLFVYFPEENELTINDIKEDEDFFKPSDIFTLYEKDFLYAMAGTARKGDQRFHIIKFTPKDPQQKKDAFFHSIKLYVNMVDHTIAQATIIDKNNTQMTYKINKVTPNLTVDTGLFTFDTSKYPGIIVTDKSGK